MKKVTMKVFNYQTAVGNYEYGAAISQPSKWFFVVSNGALSQIKGGYATKSAAKSAGRAYRKHAKALKLF